MNDINKAAQSGPKQRATVRPIISPCPICDQPTEITEVACSDCGIQIRGRFSASPYETLSREQKRFLETFLRCRGVLRDVEAALGISYPTVRSRLDALLATLGFDQEDASAASQPQASPVTVKEKESADASARRIEILAAISAGTMDADSGLRAIEELSAKELKQ